MLALPREQVGQIIDAELLKRKGGPGGWIILFEPELHSKSDVLVPNLAAWRRERVPELPDVAWLGLTPDSAVVRAECFAASELELAVLCER